MVASTEIEDQPDCKINRPLLREAIDRMKGGVKGALIQINSTKKRLSVSKEREQYYQGLMDRIGDNDFILVDNSELDFGLKDEISRSVRILHKDWEKITGIEDKALVSRSTVEKALKDVKESIDGIYKYGADSPHYFNRQNGYSYAKFSTMSALTFKTGTMFFENAVPDLPAKLVEGFDNLFKKGIELCTEGSTASENFEEVTSNRIDALNGLMNDLEYIEKDFSTRYRGYESTSQKAVDETEQEEKRYERK